MNRRSFLTTGLPIGALCVRSIMDPRAMPEAAKGLPTIGVGVHRVVEIRPRREMDRRSGEGIHEVLIDGTSIPYVDIRISHAKVEIDIEATPEHPITFPSGLPQINGKLIALRGLRFAIDVDHPVPIATLVFGPWAVKEPET